MAQAMEEREVSGIKLQTRQLPPMRAYRLLFRLGKLTGPMAKALDPKSIAALKAGKWAAALPLLLAAFSSLDDEEAQALAEYCLAGSSAYVMGPGNQLRLLPLTGEPAINSAFEGNLRAMLGAMLFALEVNYRDFFVASAQAESTTPTPSP